MGSACVFEEKTVIHELTQGVQMAKQLKVNVHSPEAREFLIQKILSSYENALFVLKSGKSTGQPRAPACLAGSLPESSISNGTLGSEESEFDQTVFGQQGKNVIFKKRCFNQVSICTEDGLTGNTDDRYNWRQCGQKDILGTKFPRSNYKKHMNNHAAESASPPPPPLSPEKQEITPTHHHQHHQVSPPNPGEKLSNLRANLSVDTSDFGGDIVPSLFSNYSTSFGLMEDFNQFKFPNYFDDGSDFLSEWGSSSSFEFLAGSEDADPYFQFTNSFF